MENEQNASMGELEIAVMRDLWSTIRVLDPAARVRAADWLAGVVRAPERPAESTAP